MVERRGIGERGRRPSGEIALRRLSGGVDAVKFSLEQLLRRVITKDFSRKCIYHAGKVQYVIRTVTGKALSFGNEPAQQLVVTFICPFLPRRKRMLVDCKTTFYNRKTRADRTRCARLVGARARFARQSRVFEVAKPPQKRI